VALIFVKLIRSRSCKTANMELVHGMECLFTTWPSLVHINWPLSDGCHAELLLVHSSWRWDSNQWPHAHKSGSMHLNYY